MYTVEHYTSVEGQVVTIVETETLTVVYRGKLAASEVVVREVEDEDGNLVEEVNNFQGYEVIAHKVK